MFISGYTREEIDESNARLLLDVIAMADKNSDQIFENDIARLKAIEEHISGNLLEYFDADDEESEIE